MGATAKKVQTGVIMVTIIATIPISPIKGTPILTTVIEMVGHRFDEVAIEVEVVPDTEVAISYVPGSGMFAVGKQTPSVIILFFVICV